MKNLFEYKSGLPFTPDPCTFELEVKGPMLLLHNVRLRRFSAETVQTYKIPLENIVECALYTDQELENKNPVVRGAIGGLLFGPIGLVLGAASGRGQKAKYVCVLGIAYLSVTKPYELQTFVFDAEYEGWLNQNIRFYRKKLAPAVDATPKSAAVHEYIRMIGGGVRDADGTILL